jgi:uncharacterized membrane protein YjgN (DUF898 family)
MSKKSLQDTYAANSICYGCGSANPNELPIIKFAILALLLLLPFQVIILLIIVGDDVHLKQNPCSAFILKILYPENHYSE